MKTVTFTRSELVRVRNLLCREIGCVPLAGGLDPEHVSRSQLKYNTIALKHDHLALAKIVDDADATLEKYKTGRFWKSFLRACKKKKETDVKRLVFAIKDRTWQEVKD